GWRVLGGRDCTGKSRRCCHSPPRSICRRVPGCGRSVCGSRRIAMLSERPCQCSVHRRGGPSYDWYHRSAVARKRSGRERKYEGERWSCCLHSLGRERGQGGWAQQDLACASK